MSDTIRKLYGEITLKDRASAEIKKFRSSMDYAKKSIVGMTDKFGNTFDPAINKLSKGFHEIKESAGEMGQILGAAWGAEKVKDFISESVKEFANAETQALRLKHFAGESYETIKKGVEEATAAAEGLVTKDNMTEAANQALRLGSSVEFVSQNLSSMQKLSQVAGMDLTDMMHTMASATMSGRAQMLKSIPVLNKHLQEFKNLGKGMDEFSRKKREAWMTEVFKKESATIAKQYNEELLTTNAQLKIMKAQWAEIKELIGGMIIKEWGPTVQLISLIMKHFNALEVSVEGFASVFEYLTPLTTYTLKAIKFILYAVEDLLVAIRGGKSVLGEFGHWVHKTFDDFLDYLKNIPRKIIEFFLDLPRKLRETLAEIKNDLADVFSPGSSGGKPALDFLPIPGEKKKAAGGPVSYGNSYLVGERGPELFTPNQSGNITPNNRMGGMSIGSLIGSLVINVTGTEKIGHEIESQVIDALNNFSRTTLRAELGMGLT